MEFEITLNIDPIDEDDLIQEVANFLLELDECEKDISKIKNKITKFKLKEELEELKELKEELKELKIKEELKQEIKQFKKNQLKRPLRTIGRHY